MISSGCAISSIWIKCENICTSLLSLSQDSMCYLVSEFNNITQEKLLTYKPQEEKANANIYVLLFVIWCELEADCEQKQTISEQTQKEWKTEMGRYIFIYPCIVSHFRSLLSWFKWHRQMHTMACLHLCQNWQCIIFKDTRWLKMLHLKTSWNLLLSSIPLIYLCIFLGMWND